MLAVHEDVSRGEGAVVVATLDGEGHGLRDAEDDVHEDALTEILSGGGDVHERAPRGHLAGVIEPTIGLASLIQWGDAGVSDLGFDALTLLELGHGGGVGEEVGLEQYERYGALHGVLHGAVGLGFPLGVEAGDNLVLAQHGTGGHERGAPPRGRWAWAEPGSGR